MVQIPLGRIAILLIGLSLAFFAFFLWLRRSKAKKMKERYEDLREEFVVNSKNEIAEASKEDKKALEKITTKIKEVIASNGNEVHVDLEDKYGLHIEAPDLLVLETPNENLYKTFSQTSFEKIEKAEEETKITLSTE